MPLPAGFKVDGSHARTSLPPRPQVKKIIDFLESSEPLELFSTRELSERLSMSNGGCKWQDPHLADHCEKVDSKMFWGSRKSIKQLRDKLNEANR